MRDLRGVLEGDKVTLSVFDVVNWAIRLRIVRLGLGSAIDVVRKGTLRLIVPRGKELEVTKQIKEVDLVAEGMLGERSGPV